MVDKEGVQSTLKINVHHHQRLNSKKPSEVTVPGHAPVTPELQRQENYFKFEARLHSNFHVSQGYIERLCLKTTKTQRNQFLKTSKF